MIDFLDNILRDLLLQNVGRLSSEDQVRFQPPDDVWRTYVAGLTVDGQPADALNVYLADLRENRELRSNARSSEARNGQVERTPAPARVDCHYLISAWSPAPVSPAVEPTLDEHGLLYEALAALVNAAPINASRIYSAGSAALDAVPVIIRYADLPTAILPVEGFGKLAEYWGATGEGYRWKPVLYIVVTLPVALYPEPAVPMVTTRVIEYRSSGQAVTMDVRIGIGGRVLDGRVEPAVPVVGAWVRLEDAAGDPLQTTATGDDGRFTFQDVVPGTYRLDWRAAGYPIPPARRDVEVPSPTGEYDLVFS